MNKAWGEPFLGLHAAAIAIVPLGLVLTQLGLAAGDPWLWPPLEIALVATLGLAPVAWLQALKPIYPFNALRAYVPPRQLNRSRRRLLRAAFGSTWLRLHEYQWLVALVTVLLLLALVRMYWSAPLWAGLTFVKAGWLSHGVGLAIASVGLALASLGAHLHVMALKLLSVGDLKTFEPMTKDEIEAAFFFVGKAQANLWKDQWPQTGRSPQSPTAPESSTTAAS
ncbi:MAG: low-complexity tail membrane protein [Cyanobacteria bacterium J06639_1]